MRRLPIITNSATRTYRSCPRAYLYRYELGYRPLSTAHALSFGRLIHSALEAWWSAESGTRLVDAMQVIHDADADDFDRVKAEELLRGYHARWSDETAMPVLIEGSFSLPLVNPETGGTSRTFELGGKWDAIVEVDGELWLMEHKSSSENIQPGSTYWQKLRLDTQISTYMRAAQEMGYPVVGCIYDVIGKPSIKPRYATPEESRKYKKDGTLYANQRGRDETPDEYRTRLREHIIDNPDRYYQRGEVVRLGSEEREAAFDLWQTTQAIRDSRRAQAWPRNTDSCFKFQRACDYWPVCSGETHLDDPLRYVRVDNVHPELDTEAA